MDNWIITATTTATGWVITVLLTHWLICDEGLVTVLQIDSTSTCTK